MEDLSSAPPLPPKTRPRVCVTQAIPSTAATVYISSPPKTDTYSFSYRQVQGPDNNQEPTNTGHVVKIKINPTQNEPKNNQQLKTDNETKNTETRENLTSVVNLNSENYEGCIRINVGTTESEEMIQNNTTETFLKTPERANPYFFYSAFPANAMVMSSGQCSPSDTLDSGTCSDLDSTPPPLPKKKSVSVTVIGAQHKRASSLTSGENDSDNDSNISCDSLNSSELNEDNKRLTKTPSPELTQKAQLSPVLSQKSVIPQGLLQDIRGHSKVTNGSEISSHHNGDLTVETTLQSEDSALASPNVTERSSLVDESTYEERQIEKKQNELNKTNHFYEADKYYKFHLNENVIEEEKKELAKDNDDDELFAGYKDILGNGSSSTIRSAKGTVRGVKNRVRAGIATFLQINSTAKVSPFLIKLHSLIAKLFHDI